MISLMHLAMRNIRALHEENLMMIQHGYDVARCTALNRELEKIMTTFPQA